MTQWYDVTLDKCAGIRIATKQQLHSTKEVMKVDFILEKYRPITVTVDSDLFTDIHRLPEPQRRVLFLCFKVCPEFFNGDTDV